MYTNNLTEGCREGLGTDEAPPDPSSYFAFDPVLLVALIKKDHRSIIIFVSNHSAYRNMSVNFINTRKVPKAWLTARMQMFSRNSARTNSVLRAGSAACFRRM